MAVNDNQDENGKKESCPIPSYNKIPKSGPWLGIGPGIFQIRVKSVSCHLIHMID
jgi:hypothetical protein